MSTSPSPPCFLALGVIERYLLLYVLTKDRIVLTSIHERMSASDVTVRMMGLE